MEIAVRFTRGGKTNLIFSLTLNKLMKINYFMSDNPKKCALKLKKNTNNCFTKNFSKKTQEINV